MAPPARQTKSAAWALKTSTDGVSVMGRSADYTAPPGNYTSGLNKCAIQRYHAGVTDE